MDSKEFRERGRELIDYVANYAETIEKRRVTPNIEPGYLKELIPAVAPENPDRWDDLMKDVEDKIMIGMTHWQHPRFHAYFPSGNSYPSILADILGDALGCIGFSWAAGPACTELETVVLDWVGQMMGLPNQFLALNESGKGGGVIQTSASECVLVSILAARAQAIKKLKSEFPDEEEGFLLSKLMAYCSKEAHSCVEKGAMISFVKLRILEPDDNFSLRGATLRKAMEEDRKNGLLPFFVSLTVGTTSCCSVDNLEEIGPICEEFDAWLHVDAAYAGSAMVCPEFRPLFKGIEKASSLNTNPNKWMLTNFDCSCYWVKDRFKLTQALTVDPLYLKHNFDQKSIDYRHWGVPLSRRFRSLKLWFVIRMYGVEGLRRYIREHCRLAKVFEGLVRNDSRFEVMNKVQMGLVCFRLKGSNGLNQKLLSMINASGKLHMVPASLNDRYVIRFCVCRETATDADMEYAWNVIKEYSADVIVLYNDGDLQVPPSPVQTKPDESRRPSKEVEELYNALAEGRRFSLARHTSTISEDEKLEKEEEEESQEKIAELEEKRKADLKYKRSFFVRMVSDPKIYNPKIVKARYPSGKVSVNQNNSRDLAKSPGGFAGGQVTAATTQQAVQNPSPIASWISWPLAFMFQEVVDEVSNEVPFRFRNWESTLTIKPSAAKTSPEGEGTRPVSPFGRRSRSPQQPSKSKSPTPNSHYLEAPNGKH